MIKVGSLCYYYYYDDDYNYFFGTRYRDVARHNFKRRQLSHPLPINGGPGVLLQIFVGILHCCRRVLVHFRRTKTNFPLPGLDLSRGRGT